MLPHRLAFHRPVHQEAWTDSMCATLIELPKTCLAKSFIPSVYCNRHTGVMGADEPCTNAMSFGAFLTQHFWLALILGAGAIIFAIAFPLVGFLLVILAVAFALIAKDTRRK